MPDITSPLKSPEDLPVDEIQFMMPSLYKYPDDGSLLMPEIPDIIHEESTNNKKRTAYTAALEEHQHQDKRAHH
jgi:hypothetical protein